MHTFLNGGGLNPQTPPPSGYATALVEADMPLTML